ncbi:hypothetical protein JL101_035865 (plasmid) [Skermanella rosea]|uniref:hypothetical protein n=1 Tax=Skermanella rosea TaxID=1817965 RepID=UPI00193250C7|nr:hypothetical protein [Skermanella rosea]UEM08030.1 hypothetical protein JL101_035865 [Skermanella rosea]
MPNSFRGRVRGGSSATGTALRTAEVPSTLVSLVDEDANSPIYLDTYDRYRVMRCLRGGRIPAALLLHPEKGADPLPGSIAWWDIWRIVPDLERATAKAPQTIALYIRDGSRCLIEGFHLEPVMARLHERHVIEMWAYRADKWPDSKPGKGEPIVTAIRWFQAES